MESRFDRLESKPLLPENVKQAVSRLERFGHLEIGALQNNPQTPAATPGRLLCRHCSQSNEPQREICWACFKPLKVSAPAPVAVKDDNKPSPGQEIAIVLDGKTYRQSDPTVPEDIKLLMDRIRTEGYSDGLIDEWRKSRKESKALSPNTAQREDPLSVVPKDLSSLEVFEGQHVAVLRIDGKVYLSDDPSLDPRIREIFDFVHQHGVTPELIDHLRKSGEKVKFRPATTAQPTDGDIDFWNSVDVKNTTPEVRRASMLTPWSEWAKNHPEVMYYAIRFGIPAIIIFGTVKSYLRLLRSLP